MAPDNVAVVIKLWGIMITLGIDVPVPYDIHGPFTDSMSESVVE